MQSRTPRGKVARKRAPRRDWSRRVEVSSVASAARLPPDAVEAFRGLSAPDRMALTREICAARGAELTLAYRNVIAVTAGHRQRRVRGGDKVRLYKEPCVIFIVRRKWPRRAGTSTRNVQLLPEYLLGYWTVGSERVLCAAPTDVITEHSFYAAAPQAMTGVEASGADGRTYFGNIGCVVDATTDEGTAKYLLSCLHVFSPVGRLDADPPPSGKSIFVYDEVHGEPLAESAPIGGALSRGTDNFDVQLAMIKDSAAVQRAMSGCTFSDQQPYIKSRRDFDVLVAVKHSLRIVVAPRNENRKGRSPQVRAVYARDRRSDLTLPYKVIVDRVQKEIEISFPGLIDLSFVEEETVPGDSGSPVVVRAADGNFTLVGIHIAGGGGYSVMIPAWHLFQLQRYNPMPFDLVLRNL